MTEVASTLILPHYWGNGSFDAVASNQTDQLTPLLPLLAELDILNDYDPADAQRVRELREQISQHLGPNLPTKIRHARDLIDAGYMHGKAEPGMGESGFVHVEGLGPIGRRALGHWPTEGEALIRVLIAAVEEAQTTASEEDRGKLKRLLDSLRDLTTGAGGEVLGSVLVRIAGL